MENTEQKVEVVMNKETYDLICKLIKQREKNRENMKKIFREKNPNAGTRGEYQKPVKNPQFDSVKFL